MTIPLERTRTVIGTREFLRALMNPKETPRVPLAVRQQARSLLKHYPSRWDIERLAAILPTSWGKIE